MNIHLVAECCGVMGIIFSLLSFQRKERKSILTLLIIALIFCEMQAILSRAVTGVCVDTIALIRAIIYSRRGTNKWASHIVWPIIFCGATIVGGIISWQNIYSIGAIAGGFLQAIALWMKETKKLRLLSFMSGPCWITYNIANTMYAGVLNEIIAMTSIIIAMARHDFGKKKAEI